MVRWELLPDSAFLLSQMVRAPWPVRSAECGSPMKHIGSQTSPLSLPQMKNLGVSLDLRGTHEQTHTLFLKGRGVPLLRNRAGYPTLNVKNICKRARASAHKGRQLHAASSFPAIADAPEPASLRLVQPPAMSEPVPPPPAIEKKYRLPSGQKLPAAHLHKRAAERIAERRAVGRQVPQQEAAPVLPGRRAMRQLVGVLLYLCHPQVCAADLVCGLHGPALARWFGLTLCTDMDGGGVWLIQLLVYRRGLLIG